MSEEHGETGTREVRRGGQTRVLPIPFSSKKIRLKKVAGELDVPAEEKLREMDKQQENVNVLTQQGSSTLILELQHENGTFLEVELGLPEERLCFGGTLIEASLCDGGREPSDVQVRDTAESPMALVGAFLEIRKEMTMDDQGEDSNDMSDEGEQAVPVNSARDSDSGWGASHWSWGFVILGVLT